ncbi:MAG: hypothetical protein R8M45_05480 [Ghiorsea sp.]
MKSFASYLIEKENDTTYQNSVLFCEDIDLFIETDMAEISESEELTEKSRTAPLNPQIWGDASTEDAVTSLYAKFIDQVKSSQKTLLSGLKRSSMKVKDAKVYVDVKHLDSFIDKILKRGKKASSITDWLRSAVIAPDEEGVGKIVKSIRRDFVVQEYEFKDKKNAGEYGYFGSHHFLVLVDGITAEIQVMTRKLWVYKEEAHKVYVKYRSDGKLFDKFKKLETSYSRKTFSKGNLPTPR